MVVSPNGSPGTGFLCSKFLAQPPNGCGCGSTTTTNRPSKLELALKCFRLRVMSSRHCSDLSHARQSLGPYSKRHVLADPECASQWGLMPYAEQPKVPPCCTVSGKMKRSVAKYTPIDPILLDAICDMLAPGCCLGV